VPEILQEFPLIGCAVGQSYTPPVPEEVLVRRPPVDVVVVIGITVDVVPPLPVTANVLVVVPPVKVGAP
jgi:hypothetical protein